MTLNEALNAVLLHITGIYEVRSFISFLAHFASLVTHSILWLDTLQVIKKARS